ncbi:MAG: chromosome segregation protein SMC [Lachnospiraceae bacterium]|nr:chromosome segregation protein SMC [Lachnospiraceae bacterium]
MYLKSIEVHGFKSFANKLKFEFHGGITGIVGPNGSGKSNVVDAVRWVFGEQSAKQLRGGNMQDVIFAGSELRRPQSYAEVAITLDNGDHSLDIAFDEVKITRRLYRSGESEYLINDRSSRLKDINELFYDTGIGKEGYSIIGQNQIEKILSGKADDRRELFDEAAGIVKFKRRKNTAVKKLESEQQNLLRVGDILRELSSQLGPLEKQSANARIYLKKKESLKAFEVNLFLREMDETESRLKELTEKIAIVTQQMTDSQNAYEEIKTEYDEIEAALAALDEAITTVHDEGAAAVLKKQELKGHSDLLKEQIRTAQNDDEHFENRRQTIAEEIRRRQEEIAGNVETQASLTAAIASMGEEEARESELFRTYDEALTNAAAKLDELQSRMIELLNDRANTKSRIQRFDTMLEQIDIRKAELMSRSLRFKEEETDAQAIIDRSRSTISEIDEEMARLKAETAEKEKAQAVCQNRINENSHRLDEVQVAYHREASHLESLKNLEEHYDGYGNGIRRVMEEKVKEPGIVGVVAELLFVDKKYELAVETALGSKTRNVVTDEEQTAKRMINFLKKNKLGRATFLPMTHINGGRSFEPRSALQENGVVGLASKLCTTKPGYEVLADYLLGRTLVIDNIDNALRIGAKYKHGLNMVTLQGELFTPGGAITGGAFKSTSSLLGRHREIEELSVSSVKLKEELTALQDSIRKDREERNNLRQVIVDLHEKLQDASIRRNTADMQLRQAEERLGVSRLSSTELSDESKEITVQIAQIKENRSGMEAELTASENEEATLSREAEALQKETEDLQQKKEAQNTVLEKIRLQHLSLKQQSDYISENDKRLESEIAAFEEEDKTLLAGRENSAKEVEEREERIAAIEAEAAALDAEIEAAGEKERELIDEKNQLSVEHRNFFDKREALSQELARLDKENFRLTSHKEHCEENREKQTAYMWEEYEITPSEAATMNDPELGDRSVLKSQVSGLKDEIRKLGPVNVNAIEEYKAVSERHAFLSEQHDDLIKSEESLMKIIEELDEGMKKLFNERFAIINREFDKVIKEMFGGGTGHLDLKDAADILETDIAITVQPPGKKLQNINLLSGGERALTAIALLFAIQNMKPSPFCVLDEIEAALDESNVERFARYLKKLTRHTQFVVITHRRGTMASADRLYGITMMEKGVSTLVSVNLIEDKLDN